jgi:hypothetical protein
MMGITSILSARYTQVAVYWGSPVDDGMGGYTFSSPIEIPYRWEEMSQLVADNKGDAITSRACIYVTQDLDEEGMLYLGSLDDLNSDTELDPKSVDGAYFIKRFEKSPALGSTTEFLRKAYLTPSLSFGGF